MNCRDVECYDAPVGIFLLGKNDAIDGGGANMHPALASFTFARGSRTVKNRCVLAAMTNKQSHSDGTLSNEEIRWLEMRAEGGFGIVTTAASNVSEYGKGWEGEFGVWSDQHVPGLTELATRISKNESIGLVQLFHGGMRAPEGINGVQPVSASENGGRGMNGTLSRAMSEEEIEAVILDFGKAAARCERAGFEGVELHGAHGYLIAQFLGAETNRRTDKWGGSIDNRWRFLQSIITTVREHTGPDFLVGLRLSPVLASAGFEINDALETVEMCTSMELDFIHVSCWDIDERVEYDGHNNTYTEWFAHVLKGRLPLFTTGMIWNAADAQKAIEQGADFVGVGRVGIAHPDWPRYLVEGSKSPDTPPFSPKQLSRAGLSSTFIKYMRAWEGFVSD